LSINIFRLSVYALDGSRWGKNRKDNFLLTFLFIYQKPSAMFDGVVELNRGQPLGQPGREICRPKGAHSLEVGLCAGRQNFG
jgi:hypothetical protein